MEKHGNRVLCRNLFKKLQILPLTSQYILTLSKFVVQNNFFSTNNENYNLDTRKKNVYLPQEIFTIYQKAAYYLEIKIFNTLSLEIKKVACQR